MPSVLSISRPRHCGRRSLAARSCAVQTCAMARSPIASDSLVLSTTSVSSSARNSVIRSLVSRFAIRHVQIRRSAATAPPDRPRPQPVAALRPWQIPQCSSNATRHWASGIHPGCQRTAAPAMERRNSAPAPPRRAPGRFACRQTVPAPPPRAPACTRQLAAAAPSPARARKRAGPALPACSCRLRCRMRSRRAPGAAFAPSMAIRPSAAPQFKSAQRRVQRGSTRPARGRVTISA